jgi:hypothetical protein
VTLAREAIGRGNAVIDSDRAVAAREARAAQQAIGEGKVLLDAVENLATQLVEARSNLAARLAEAEESMLKASQSASREGQSLPELQEIRRRLEEARRLASADPPDLLAAYQLARHADASADELLASLQTVSQERNRTRTAAELELAAAEAEYERADDFIRGRRGSVGREARTRLTEAERLLSSAQALRTSNPQKALEQARRASDLAADAYAIASSDFDENQTWGGDIFGGVGGMLPGMIILGGMMGGRGGFGGFGGGRGSQGFGGFGGGRSMGGMFGGLGGRSRGGRW